MKGITQNKKRVLSGKAGGLLGLSCMLVPFAGCLQQGTEDVKFSYDNYASRTALVYPLTGYSLIAAGGPELSQNPFHGKTRDQRFAFDIVGVEESTQPPELTNFVDRALKGEIPFYRGDFTQYQNHFCFGRAILAPGAGKVAGAKNGVVDNPVHETNPSEMPGNFVVIDHLNGEFSMLAHMRKGSVTVKEGEWVTQGQVIGECGNSGNSSLPHLHYHLQDSPNWLDGNALPIRFIGKGSDNEFQEPFAPVQGDILFQLK